MSTSVAISVYTRLLEAWNRRDAAAFAALFGTDGLAIGFDGSQMQGRSAIERELAGIFTNHVTAAYVAKVRSIRALANDTMLVHAVVGMVPPGKKEINPAVNAIQTVLVVGGTAPTIALLQSTPAEFHGRPQLVEQLTAELSAVLQRGVVVAED